MGFLKTLLKKNTVLLLSAQLISDLGNVMQTFALSLYVYAKTQSEVLFASVLAAAMVPRLFGPFSGALTDRMNRKRLLVLLDALSGCISLGFAAWHLFVSPLPIPCVYVFVVLLACVQVFNDPTVNAIIPELVEEEALRNTNVASSFILSTTAIVGPVLASFLRPGTDGGLLVVMVVNGCSFFAAAAIESLFKNRNTVDAARAAAESVLASMKEGLRTVFANRELLLIVAVSMVANFALYPVFSAGVSIVMLKDLKVSDELFGISRSIQYIGPVLGSVLAGVVLQRQDYRRLLPRILAADSALLALMAGCLLLNAVWKNLVAPFLLINLSALFIVASVVVAAIAMTTAIQRIVPGHLLGRVSGVDTSFSVLAVPLGQMLFGLLSNTVNSLTALLCFSVFTLASSLAAYLLYKPMLKQNQPAMPAGQNAERQ